jgi:predicted RNase H-like HicB family nuclease/uncharacterized damage-inducible protein DinB
VTRYAVYLETADDGRCMAHVLDLPGCIARAPSRAEALVQLRDAIRDYRAWLQRHGEAALTEEEPIEIEIAGHSTGFGPFDPRSAAALFPPDLEPVTPEDVERHLRLMTYSRADLLALVQAPSTALRPSSGRGLPDDLLDWQPDADAFSIRRLLRHVGNAEEWYVSRLVPPETLPPEWESDADLPIFEFLEMERRTAVARLRQLTEEGRSAVRYPTAWAYHPEEPWTARKALRRFLEHEREHTAQVREILVARRRELLARLAAERAALLGQLVGLDERTLVEEPVVEDWTVKDLLAHVAAWDRWEDRTMRCMAVGEVPDLTAVRDFDASNAVFVAEWRDRTLDEVLTELQAARADWMAWLESLPEEEFFRPRSYEGWDWAFSREPVEIQWQHDAEHAAQIANWREGRGLKT